MVVIDAASAVTNVSKEGVTPDAVLGHRRRRVVWQKVPHQRMGLEEFTSRGGGEGEVVLPQAAPQPQRVDEDVCGRASLWVLGAQMRGVWKEWCQSV